MIDFICDHEVQLILNTYSVFSQSTVCVCACVCVLLIKTLWKKKKEIYSKSDPAGIITFTFSGQSFHPGVEYGW